MEKASFRLPSEVEWEFAAKGGVDTKSYELSYEFCGSDDLKQVGWFDDNSGNETKPAGLLLPNELGLFDMSGNVWEWCEDDWHGTNEFENEKRPKDGSAWIDGSTPTEGHEPGDTRRQLPQQPDELPALESQQQPARQPHQQLWLSVGFVSPVSWEPFKPMSRKRSERP
ncbi:MAG: sulfatase activating formylglycine-generating enzyme [Ulvibacter sp.]